MNNKFKDFFGFGDNDSYEERDAYEEHYDEQEEMQNSNRPTNSRDSNVVSIKDRPGWQRAKQDRPLRTAGIF